MIWEAFAEDIEGTPGDDVLIGTNEDDDIDSGYGDDTNFVPDNNNVIKRGNCDDQIRGEGAGEDKIDAGSGNDYMEGDPSADKFQGGSGEDTVIEYNPDQGDKATSNCELFEN